MITVYMTVPSVRPLLALITHTVEPDSLDISPCSIRVLNLILAKHFNNCFTSARLLREEEFTASELDDLSQTFTQALHHQLNAHGMTVSNFNTVNILSTDGDIVLNITQTNTGVNIT